MSDVSLVSVRQLRAVDTVPSCRSIQALVSLVRPTPWEMGAPQVLVEVLSQPPEPAHASPRALLTEALHQGLSEAGRYVPALAALSFPQGFWHTESVEDCIDIASTTLADLGASLPEGFLEGLDLDVETLYGPEDYETGPGSESWARREQVQRICEAANGALEGDRRFYAFAEDLPDWEFDEDNDNKDQYAQSTSYLAQHAKSLEEAKSGNNEYLTSIPA